MDFFLGQDALCLCRWRGSAARLSKVIPSMIISNRPLCRCFHQRAEDVVHGAHPRTHITLSYPLACLEKAGNDEVCV